MKKMYPKNGFTNTKNNLYEKFLIVFKATQPPHIQLFL